MNNFPVPAPTIALITYTVWPKILIPPHHSKDEMATWPPKVKQWMREMSEFRHGRAFNFPGKISFGKNDDLPCVVAPYITEVGA